MSILDEVIAAKKDPGTTCSVGAWLATQPPKEQTEWAAVMALPVAQVSHAQIHEVMKARGFAYGRSPVERHRAAECRCPR